MPFLLFLFYIITLTQIESYKEKFCFNCKYFIPSSNGVNHGKCKMFPTGIENNNFLVSGVRSDTESSYRFCSTARSCDTLCGPYGHYHIRKYKKK